MSDWTDFGMREMVLNILAENAGSEEHHLGNAFMTAYQIAIVLKVKHHQLFNRLDLAVGGKETGESPSLAAYLARQLSQAIKNGDPDIEGGFLSSNHLQQLSFLDKAEVVVSSMTSTERGVSLFRLKVKRAN